MGHTIQYKTILPLPGDTFSILLRKLAQKLGVPVSAADNIYRVMWNILADQSWTLGSERPYVTVNNTRIKFRTLLPKEADSLNVLFLKFWQRTGHFINVQSPTNAIEVITDVIGEPTETFTLTYTNPYGTLIGDAVQSVSGGASGTPVEAVTVLSLVFVQWDDGNTANPRTDVATADATFSATVWTPVEYGSDPFDDFADFGLGVEVDSIPSGSGWWDVWIVKLRYTRIVSEDDFSSISAGETLDDGTGGTGWSEPWSVYA